MKNETRIPKQKRATKKYDKLIKAGWDLITEKGYYNTNTKEIAKKANVSTGIVYQYFEDKHDILLAGINKYGDSIFFPSLKMKEDFKILDLSSFMKKAITEYIKNQKLSKKAHEEILSMVYTDPDIEAFYYKRELALTDELYRMIKNSGYKPDNLKEKVHVIVGIIDNLSHEIVYHKHRELNYEKMAVLVVNSIEKIIKE